MLTIKRILVPTDFSDFSKSALPYAVDLAKKYGAKITVIHVFDEELLSPIFFQVGAKAEEYYAQLRAAFDNEIANFLASTETDGVEIESFLTNGKPFVEIVRYARENGVDLIVQGTHGKTGIAQALLGSVTEKVVRKAPCPVMVVRPMNFEFRPI